MYILGGNLSMRKKLEVTYVLKTTPAQFRYLKTEMHKTMQMYETICKEQRRCQKQYELSQRIKGYARAYLPNMSPQEMAYMEECIRLQRTYTLKHVVGTGFVWRGIHLFQMLLMPHAWMKEPVLYHAPILNSHLYEKNDQLYLHICFGHNHT